MLRRMPRLIMLALVSGCCGCVADLFAHQSLRSHGAGVIPDGSRVDFDSNPGLTDADVADMSWALREFAPETLRLDGTKVTDKCLTTVAKMSSLRRLHLGGTAVTSDGIEAFLKQRPRSLRFVGVPNHWDKEPELARRLDELIAAHPDVEINLMYFNGHFWAARNPGAAEESLE